MMSPCTSCHAGCCRSYAIPLSGADVIRIERGLGLSFWEFACRWADPDGRIAGRYAPHLHFADEPQTPFVLCLLQRASDVFRGSTKCRFLMECPPDEAHPLGTARCGIYAHRPAACRVFPTKFADGSDVAEILEVPNMGRTEEHPAYSLCPRQWETADIDPLQAPQDLAVARFEMQFFHQVAALWNRTPGPWSLFPEFLHQVYARRVIKRSVESDRQRHVIPLPVPEARPATKAA